MAAFLATAKLLSERPPGGMSGAVGTVKPGALPVGELGGEDEGAEAQKREGTGEDQPDEAFGFRALQLQDDEGKIALDGLVNASEQAARLRAASRTGDSIAGIDSGGWTWLGPGNVGGRTRSLVVHPTSPNTIWAGSAGGGIWKTTNGGALWQPLDDFAASLRVSTLVIDKTNPDVLYAGTGEGIPGMGHHPNANPFNGAGVLKTTDGGTTWTQLGSTTGANWLLVNRLALSPVNSQVILAATGSGIWRTTDAGASAWTRTLSSAAAVDLDFHPTNGNLAVASGTGAAWYTLDGGASWTAATGLPAGGRIEIAYARSAPSTVYASVDVSGGLIYRSTDGGQSYTQATTGTPAYLGGQGWYDNIIWVDPTNANTVVVGGIDLFRSTNGGATLTKISDWAAEQISDNSIHADHHAIVEHPNFGAANRTVFFGNDGGVYTTANIDTADDTTGWVELNNNYGATQFYSGAGNPTSGRILGGTQDNGTPAYQGGAGATGTWTSVFGGDGGKSAIDPTNSSYVYGEYVNLRIFRNTNGGVSTATTQYISGGTGGNGDCVKPDPYRIPDACTKVANFIAPFVLDPNNAQRILAGGTSLWRTNDARTANTATTGPSWASIKPSVGSPISAIAVAPGNSNIVWVGHNNGLIYKTTNGTATTPTWTRVDLAEMPARMVLDLEIDRNDTDVVYASFGGYTASNLWRTTNGGTGWSVRTGTPGSQLPDAPLRSVVTHPTDSSKLYLGSEVGVFASEDAGATWKVPHDGPANVSVDELFWNGGTTLVAATYGRGMFFADVAAVRPPNDEFADAIGLTGTNADRTGDTNVGATKEPGEPNHVEPNAGGASVWYRWTPSADGQVTIDTAGSSFDTVLAVYTGTAVNGLTKLASNDDESTPTILTSKVQLNGTAGTTYRIAVDGFKETGQEVGRGSINLHLVQTVAATHQLTVAKNGTGTGTVTSSPAGIDCGATCAASFSAGTQVTLTATPAPSSTFAGWSGACTGTAGCVVTMDTAKAVTATFTAAAVTHQLAVSKSGTGAGTVTSSPAGIDCGTACAVAFAAGTQVTLSATPQPGSSFAGWSGDCTGSTGCVVTMDAAKAVTATFTLAPVVRQLTVTKNGPGTVTSSPTGIDCGVACSAGFDSGTQVTLTATADDGADFVGWSGACSGTNPVCQLTMDADRSAAAGFLADAPANDAFADAITLTGAGGERTSDTTTGATKQTGEPNHAGNIGGASVWYRISSAQAATVTLDTHGSSFDTLLGVYTGASVAGLTSVAGNDDEDYPVILTSKLSFNAAPGATYLVAVDGYNNAGAGPASGPLAISWNVVVDTSPPANPLLSSPSHTAGFWSADNTVDVNWSAAVDPESGVDGFSYLFDTSAATVPDQVKDAEESSVGVSSAALADGSSHYFHLRTRDNAGNWSGAVHLGPFQVDTGAPTDPLLTSFSHAPGVPSFDTTVDVNWTGAADVRSGVDGFSFHWDTSPLALPDQLKEAEEGLSGTTSPPLAAGGSYYFHLRTRDNAGNWTATVHIGPFVISAPPINPPVARHRLQVTRTGAGAGSVSGVGISCGTICVADYDAGTTVALTAVAERGSRFAGWSGDCAGLAPCVAAMTGAKSVIASFTRVPTAVVVCQVPNVRGKTLAAARTALTRARCTTGRVTRAYSSKVKTGRVISQSRRPRARLPRGTRVALVVSRGPRR